MTGPNPPSPPSQPRNHSYKRGKRHREQGGSNGQQKGCAAGVQEARKAVTAKFVRAERKRARGTLICVIAELLLVTVGSHTIRCKRDYTM